jgi:predicted RNase H-like HicB family nuclease
MTLQMKKGMMEAAMTPAEYLKKPYGRYVVPEFDGTFRAEIIEFPGCIAVGDTAAKALANLEDVAASWLEATIARGLRIPEPVENTTFSGKLVVRLPRTLHKKAARVAAQEGVSLNQFIVSSVAEQVGYSSWRSRALQWHYVSVPQSHLQGWSHLLSWLSDERHRTFVTLPSGGKMIELPIMRQERSHA